MSDGISRLEKPPPNATTQAEAKANGVKTGILRNEKHTQNQYKAKLKAMPNPVHQLIFIKQNQIGYQIRALTEAMIMFEKFFYEEDPEVRNLWTLPKYYADVATDWIISCTT